MVVVQDWLGEGGRERGIDGERDIGRERSG